MGRKSRNESLRPSNGRLVGSTERGDHHQWQRVAADLQAYGDAERRAWGDTDEVILSRYLAGECSCDEAEQIEIAIAKFPRLRECVDLVRESLRRYNAAG